MNINSSTGVITWTPTSTGDYDVIVEVSDNGSPVLSETQSFTIVVSDSQPDSTNKLFLQSGGALNGTSINPSNPVLTVNSGGSIAGTLKVQAIYSGPSNNVVPFGYTPSWGSHSSSYVTVKSSLPVGTATYDVSINLNAPSTSGTYFLIFATSCEMNLGWTMSRTNWTTGTMSWNDGKDIADLTESNLDDSISTGYLYLDMLEGSTYKKSNYGIAYVKIIVSGDLSSIPTVTTLEAYDITKIAATLYGEIISTGGLTVTRKGFEYKDSAGGSTFDWHNDGDWWPIDYIHRITGLVAGHTYLYRAYAVNSKGTGYGAWKSFKTTEEIINPPSVTTVGVDNIQETTVRFIGRIDDTGGEDADWLGFRIEDTLTGSTYYPEMESGPYGTGNYYITFGPLSPGRTYKYKFYAHNSAGTGYGLEKSVTTKVSKQLVSIESSISSKSLKYNQWLMLHEYTITAHYSDNSISDIWHDKCTWSSSKPDSVYVAGGIITPLVKYSDFAIITMTYTEGGITKSDTIAITVLPYP